MAWVTMIGVVVVAGQILWMMFGPQNIMWQEEPIRVENRVVKRGDSVVLHFNYCKYKPYTADVSIYLVDNTIFSLRTVKSNLGVLCRDDLKYPIMIPETIEPGIYHIRETLDFHINPLREVSYNYDSEVFEVTK